MAPNAFPGKQIAKKSPHIRDEVTVAQQGAVGVHPYNMGQAAAAQPEASSMESWLAAHGERIPVVNVPAADTEGRKLKGAYSVKLGALRDLAAGIAPFIKHDDSRVYFLVFETEEACADCVDSGTQTKLSAWQGAWVHSHLYKDTARTFVAHPCSCMFLVLLRARRLALQGRMQQETLQHDSATGT